MLLFLLIGGVFFCVAGFFWNSRLLKYETEHRNARGLTQYSGYNGEELHENYKTWAGLFKTMGILLLIAGGLYYLIRVTQ